MKHMTRSRQRPQRGVALLEVLVSILIFSLGILGLIGLQARAISMSVDAEDRSRASLLANELVSQMWLLKSVNLSAGTKKAWQDRVANPTAGGLPDGAGDYTLTGNQVDVTITWKAPSRKDKDTEGSTLTTRVVLP